MAMGDLEAGTGGGRRGAATPLKRLVPAVAVKGAAPRRPAVGGSDGRDVANGADGGEDDSGSADGSHPVAMTPDHSRSRPSVLSVVQAAAGEFFGVFLFLFFTTSALAAKTTGSPLASLVDVTLVSGLGLAMAILVAGPRSGGHLNPALSIAVSIFRRGSLPLWELPIFVVAQVAGATAGAALTYALYRRPIAAFEAAAGLSRSSADAVATGSIFFCAFPSAGADLSGGLDTAVTGGVATWPAGLVDVGTAFLSEALGTAIIAAIVSAVLDKRAVSNLGQETAIRALAIGLAIFLLEMVLGPISSGCFNPARDLGPRIVAAIAGWDSAFPGDRGHVWVYMAAPIVGSSVGVLVYDWVLSAGLDRTKDD